MNISQHSFVPTCQYGIDPNNKDFLFASGNTSVSNQSVPRYTLYPDNASFDKRYNYMDFSMLNSILFCSTFAAFYRPFVGFPNDSLPFGPGVYINAASLESNLLTGYTYSAVQGADLDSCKTMYISDAAPDAQVRYLFWREPVRQLLGMRRSTLNYEEEEIK